VLCNIGSRRLLGKVIGIHVDDPEDPDEEPFAYVVKTEALPSLESRTISAPSDSDGCICRERCFRVFDEAEQSKWAAPLIPTDKRKPLRFGLEDKVCIRIWDEPKGYEKWVPGKVVELWPSLPKPKKKGHDYEWAEGLPYKVSVDSLGDFFCHWDDHTLIRKAENAPQTAVKSISKRMEKRKREDGTLEVVDHVTLRRRTVGPESDDDSDD